MNFWKYTFSLRVVLVNLVAKLITVLATIAAYSLGAAPLLLYVIFCSYWTLFAAFVAGSYYRWRKYLSWKKLHDALPMPRPLKGMLIPTKAKRDGPA